MTQSLKHRFSTEAPRRSLVEKVARLIDQEVGQKKGLRSLPLKGGLKILKGLRPGVIEEIINQLLDEFLEALEPYFHNGVPGTEIIDGSAFEEVADALLQVSDRRAEKVKNTALVKLYRQIRPAAREQVKQALPSLIELLK